jgi:recombination protein RecA
MANAQKEGGKVAFIDTEHALDPAYAASIGVNVDELLFAQPDCGEEALELVETLLRTRALDAIIIDSIASLVPRAEIEGQMGDSHVGLQARLMSQACRKLAPKAKQADTLVMFTNQIREKIGVMFGSPETTPGGKAMKFYASVRMDIRRIGQIKEGSDKDADVIGNKVRIKVVKNKVGPAFKKAETRIMTDGLGFDDTYDCINMGLKYGLLKQKGSWYSYGDESLAQGMESLKDLLNEPQNEEFLAELRQDIINIHYSQFEEEIEEEEEEEEPKKKKKKKSKKKKKKSKKKGK